MANDSYMAQADKANFAAVTKPIADAVKKESTDNPEAISDAAAKAVKEIVSKAPVRATDMNSDTYAISTATGPTKEGVHVVHVDSQLPALIMSNKENKITMTSAYEKERTPGELKAAVQIAAQQMEAFNGKSYTPSEAKEAVKAVDARVTDFVGETNVTGLLEKDRADKQKINESVSDQLGAAYAAAKKLGDVIHNHSAGSGALTETDRIEAVSAYASKPGQPIYR